MAFSYSMTELAYAAGIVDGEGYLAIRMRANQKGVKYHTVTVTVANTDLGLIEWLRATFGGTTRINQRSNHNPAHKQLHVWQLNTKAAEVFLREIEPFLIVKRKQAQICLALRDRVGKTFERLNVGEFEEREALRLSLRELTKRGV